MAVMVKPLEDNARNEIIHKYNNNWILWTHLPNDDWSFHSYKKIITIETVEQALSLFENFPENIIKNSMLFLMKDGIKPIWEDELNKDGGCFSYKVNNKLVNDLFKKMAYVLMGENLASPEINKLINGITISPKKNFCIIKIWFSTCQFDNPDIIYNFESLNKIGCLFKKHISY